MFYEHKKHDGSLPIIGVNTFLGKPQPESVSIELARSTEDEKQNQIKRLGEFQQSHETESEQALASLKQVLMDGGNGFEALMEAVKFCSLGQITEMLFEVGGQYRRNM